MLKFPLHKKFKNFVKVLNNIYKNYPCFFEVEDSWDGFKWISVDERENNVLAFSRIDKNGNKVLAIFNFSGNDYSNYRLGAEKGKYKLLISSDQKRFGGLGKLKLKNTKAVKKCAHNSKYSIILNLPKLSGAYFIKVD